MIKPVNYVSNHLNLPDDVICGSCIVTSYGNRYVFIENYKRIILYTDENILVQGKNCRIEIKGSRLAIKYYTDNDMRIDGRIESVCYSV